ncbi:cytochrome b5 reductase 4-like isoform X1 [Armigeres subalbatus]|uniref:cytochrome b5 reductase 4-like isoform X1 n=1 Tax=Armigeres subalbatus TaxID=124917 RepID=UPI002ED1C7B5
MSFCGWLKIFKRKRTAIDSDDGGVESRERTRTSKGSSEGMTAVLKNTHDNGGGGGMPKTNGGSSSGGDEKNVTGRNAGKVKSVDEIDLENDSWAMGEETDKVKTNESDEGNPRNKTALKPGHSLMDWIRLGNSGADLAGTGGRVRPVQHSELAIHNKPGDMWMAIRGKVYNVTSYLDFHPGGVDELMRGAGKDATNLFDEVHAWVNYESLLAKCYIGPLRSTGILKLVPEEPENSSKSPSNQMPPPSPSLSFLKPPSPSKPSVIVTPTTPAAPAKVFSENRDLSSSNENSPAKAPPVVPRFDWLQKTAEVTFIFYTKALCNPAVVVEFANNLEFSVRIFLEGNVLHRYQFQVANNLQWPCTVRQSLEAGKVELVFNKLLPGLWTNYGQMEYKRTENYPMELHEYDVATRIEITHDSCALLLRPKNNSILQSIPIGYHISVTGTVASGQVLTRSFTPVPSIAIPTNCPPTFVPLLVKTYLLGGLSEHLTRPVPLATSLQISQPSGNFPLAKLKHHNRIALLAAGSGITPMLALLCYLLERSSNKMESISLLYFNKTEGDIWCREMLDNLCARDKRLTVKHCLSDVDTQTTLQPSTLASAPVSSLAVATTATEPDDSSRPSSSTSIIGASADTSGGDGHSKATATLERGRISLAIAQQLTNVDSPLAATFVCLCGPKPFNELACQYLEQAGHNMMHVHSFQG